jgi:hypothetical protein
MSAEYFDPFLAFSVSQQSSVPVSSHRTIKSTCFQTLASLDFTLVLTAFQIRAPADDPTTLGLI